MIVLKTAVPVGQEIRTVDTIDCSGTLWLIPIWADQPDESLMMPARLICLSLLPHQETSDARYDYLLNIALPKELFDYDVEPAPTSGAIVVVDPIRLQASSSGHLH